MIVEESPTNQG